MRYFLMFIVLALVLAFYQVKANQIELFEILHYDPENLTFNELSNATITGEIKVN